MLTNAAICKLHGKSIRLASIRWRDALFVRSRGVGNVILAAALAMEYDRTVDESDEERKPGFAS